jgi:hypothetical protein
MEIVVYKKLLQTPCPKKLLVLTSVKLVARLLASDFACASSLRSRPTENPRLLTRNFLYTLPFIAERTQNLK